MATQLPDGVRLLRTLTGLNGTIGRFDWSPDGHLLATPSTDGTVRIWNTDSGACLRTVRGQDECMFAAAFDPDGRILATGGDGGTSLWDLDSGKLLNRLASGDCYDLAFSPRRNILASVNDLRIVTLWELSTGSALCQIAEYNTMFTSVAFDGKGGMLATGGDVGGTIRLWAIPSGEHLRAFDGHSVEATSVAFHPGGGILASASFDRTIRLWNVATGGTVSILEGHTGAVLALSFSGDGRVLASNSDDGTVRLWETETGRCMAVLFALGNGMHSVAFHPHLPILAAIGLCAERGIAGYVATSALCGDGLDELVGRMRAAIRWDERPTTVTTQTFKRIKNYVLELKAAPGPEKAIFGLAELRARLVPEYPATEFTDAELLTAVQHLANHGYVTQLRTSRGEPRILLAPVLLNNLAASMVLEARRNPKGLGSLEERQVLTGRYHFTELAQLSAEEREILLDSTIVMFLARSVCFRETDPLTARSYLVFPELINLKKPVVTDEQSIDEGAAYTVSGAVENVYASLVVLLGYTSTFTRTNQWRDHARYVVGDGLLCGLRKEAEREGELDFVICFGATAGTPIRTLFQSLFESFLARRELTVRRYEAVRCANGPQLNRAVVRERLAQGANYAFCPECGQWVALPPADTPIELTRAQADRDTQRQVASRRSRFEQALFRLKTYVMQEGIPAPDCFISYAWGDERQSARALGGARTRH